MSVIEDRFEIEYLYKLFAHAVDRRDFALMRSLFTDDAIEHHGAYDGPVDGYLEWNKKTMEYSEIAVHTYCNFLVHVDGDTAESECTGLVFMRLKGTPPANSISIIRHFDRYRRMPQGWRFTERNLCADWNQKFEPQPETPNPGYYLTGRTDEKDPFYTLLPGLVAELSKLSPRYAKNK